MNLFSVNTLLDACSDSVYTVSAYGVRFSPHKKCVFGMMVPDQERARKIGGFLQIHAAVAANICHGLLRFWRVKSSAHPASGVALVTNFNKHFLAKVRRQKRKHFCVSANVFHHIRARNDVVLLLCFNRCDTATARQRILFIDCWRFFQQLLF